MTDAIRLHIKELRANPWGGYLILADEQEDWFLPAGLRPATAEAVKAQLGGGAAAAVPAMVQSLLNFVNGKLVRVEITPGVGERGVAAGAIIESEGRERTLPVSLHDGALLARREGIPLLASREALRQAGIRRTETFTTLEPADAEALKRFTMGCLAVGRVDEGLAACRRLVEISDPRERDIWRTWMGDFYQLKGWPRRAAEEYAAGIAREIRWGDFFHAVRIAEKMGAIRVLADEPVRHRSPAMVEDFENDRFNNIWSSSADADNVAAPDRPTGRVRRFAYNLAAYGYPWLHIAFPDTQTWEGARRICWDVHVAPASGVETLALEFGIEFGDERSGKYLAPPVMLGPGWNSLSVSLHDPVWKRGAQAGMTLGGETLAPVLGVQFVLSAAGGSGTGSLAFTNLRIE